MKFPKKSKELQEIFKSAKTPTIFEFNGEYSVDMLTIIPSLRRFSHRKVFFSENNKVFGYNVIFKNRIWGHFFVEEGTCEELDSKKVAIINYDSIKNSFVSKGIRDHIRCVEEKTLYIGRFNYLFWGQLRFLGYFSLLKIK